MEFREISAAEFDVIAASSPEASFQQTESWAKLKAANGWQPYYVGLRDGDKLTAAALVLAKPVPLGRCIMYSPHGFLIDYHDRAALRCFTEGLRSFARRHRAVFVKLDPYLPCRERDRDGELVPGGYDNRGCVANLKELRYRHNGYNLGYENLQPRWIMAIDLRGRTIADIEKAMEARTRYSLRLNTRSGITARELCREELPEFYRLLEKTGERRGFENRPLSYYQAMWDTMHDQGSLKVVAAELDFGLARECAQAELGEIAAARKDRADRIARGVMKMNPAKLANKLKEEDTAIAKLNKQLAAIAGLRDKYGPKVIISATMFLCCGPEVLSLLTGNDEEFMAYQASYCVYYWGISYAVSHRYDRFNFYGITGDFSKANPSYGLYEFKRGFGAKVIELVGEFDLVIDPLMNWAANLAIGLKHRLRDRRRAK